MFGHFSYIFFPASISYEDAYPFSKISEEYFIKTKKKAESPFLSVLRPKNNLVEAEKRREKRGAFGVSRFHPLPLPEGEGRRFDSYSYHPIRSRVVTRAAFGLRILEP